MATKIRINKEEAKWRAESDARTLSDAIDIQNDSKRLAAAKKAAQDMIKATQERFKFATGGKMSTRRKK